MSEFLSMGGDGAYVWSAYGITLTILIVNAWLVRVGLRRALRRTRELAPETQAPRRQPKVHRVQ